MRPARLSRSAYTVVESLFTVAALAIIAATTTAIVHKARTPEAPPDSGPGTATVDDGGTGPAKSFTLAPVVQLAPPGGPSCAQATPSTVSGLVYSSPVGNGFWLLPVSAGVTYTATVSNLAPGAVGAIGELWILKPGLPYPTYVGFLWGSDAGAPAGTWRFTSPQDGLMCLRVTGVDVMISQGP